MTEGLAGTASGAHGRAPDAPPSAGREEESIGFVLRVGRALHTYGYPSHRLETMLGRVARRLGLEAQFFSQPTSIFASFGREHEQRTHLLRVEPGEVQLGKLAAAHATAREVIAGRLTPRNGTAQIEALHAAPTPYRPPLVTLAYGVASTCASRFLGGGAAEAMASFAIGVAVGELSRAFTRIPAARQLFEPAAAFLAAFIASALSLALGPYSSHVATLAGLIVLLPGLTLTSAMTELAARHLASGTARLAASLVVFLGIGFGVAMGARAAELLVGTPWAAAAPVALPAWTEWIALALAPLALTVLLQAPARDAPWIVAVGALGFLGGRVGGHVLGPELGIFVGALIAGIGSRTYGRIADRPSSLTLVPAILMIVPGSVGFRSLASLLEREVVLGVDTAFRAVLMLSALVAGLLMSNLVPPASDPDDPWPGDTPAA